MIHAGKVNFPTRRSNHFRTSTLSTEGKITLATFTKRRNGQV
jgi:hypothetical protein